jgi:Uncharacterized conserved protein (DUF2285)
MPQPDLLECPPVGDEITSYDERHFVTYLRLLDADAEGADWREAASVVLGLDVSSDAGSAERTHRNHLDRAKWMTTNGYAHLLTLR